MKKYFEQFKLHGNNIATKIYIKNERKQIRISLITLFGSFLIKFLIKK